MGMVHICDKCLKQIRKPKRFIISGEQKEPIIMMLQKMELCDECYNGIYEAIDDFVTYKS